MATISEALAAAIQHHQGNRLHAAEEIYRWILQVEPNQADAIHLLGLIAYQVGQHAIAVEYIEQAIRLNPNTAVFHGNLGAVYSALHRIPEAVACYRRALDLAPAYAEAHNNLAVALLEQGNLDEAVACYRRALELKPDYADAYNNLGVALKFQGKVDETIAYFRRALELKPDYADAHNNLGAAFQHQWKLDEAVVCFRRALELKPDYADAYNNLGAVLKVQGKLDEAMACYHRALELKPNYAEAHSNLGIVLKDRGKLDEAVAHFHRALEIKPTFADALKNLGVALQIQGKPDEAAACFRRALELKPDHAEAQSSLGMLYLEVGAFAEAERWFRQALASDPRHAFAWYQLAALLRGRLSGADLEAMHRLAAEPNLPDDDRASIHFALAEYLDARNEYARAAEHSRQANSFTLAKWSKGGQSYDPSAHARFVDQMLATFTPAFFDRVRGFGVESDRPIFIFGQPRSGTTLLEQILAGHSQVFAAGELLLSRETFELLAPKALSEARSFEALADVSAATVKHLAERFLEKLRTVNSAAPRVVDKMPANYLYLGLLATLFPKAKFIHCRRDPRDVAISCWMTNLTTIRWASEPEHIATRYREYQRLMKHWRQVLPAPLLEVDYEATVADLETVARQLVAWCGLEWDPACLAFHQGKWPVRTASASQVRQPIYTRSVGRWKNYEPFLGSLFAHFSDSESQAKGGNDADRADSQEVYRGSPRADVSAGFIPTM